MNVCISITAQLLICVSILSSFNSAYAQPAAPLAEVSTVNPAQAQFVIDPIGEYSSILEQAAEQDYNIASPAATLSDNTSAGAPPWFLRLLSTFFIEAGSIIAKWIHDFVIHWEAPAAGTLALIIHQKIFNPNVTTSNLSGNGFDFIAPQIRQLNVLIYTISQDLLLVIFILSIWKSWAHAHNGTSLVAPLIRLCFTTALLLGWPTISAFIIETSNEMIKALYPVTGTADAMQLAKGLEAVIDLGVDAAGVALIAMLSPLAATVMGAAALGSAGVAAGNIAGQSISFAAMLIFTVLATTLILQLIYIMTMQSAQTVLLYAQYMFAPIFLLFFAHPDTETVATRYIRTVVETSIWGFIWIGLLRMLVIFMTSPANVWGQVLYAVAIFQLMISTPQFVAMAHISPLSEFISAGLFSSRTVMLVRSFSRQAREFGVQTGKILTGERKSRSSSTRKVSVGTRTAYHENPTSTDETITGQSFDSSWQSTQDITELPRLSKRKPRTTKSHTDNPTNEFETKATAKQLFTPNIGTDSVSQSLTPQVEANLHSPVEDLAINRSFDSQSDADPLTSTYIVQSNHVDPVASVQKVFDTSSNFGPTMSIPINYRKSGHQITVDPQGNFQINVAPGTSTTDITRLHSIAELSKLSFHDQQAYRAAYKATQTVDDLPSNLNLAANTPLSSAQQLESSPVPSLTVMKHAILGAHSFINAETGNAYCIYLNNRFGNHNSNQSAFLSTEYSPPQLNRGTKNEA
jgi:hypothetical protein